MSTPRSILRIIQENDIGFCIYILKKYLIKNTGNDVERGVFSFYTIIIINYGKENYKEDLIVKENLS